MSIWLANTEKPAVRAQIRRLKLHRRAWRQDGRDYRVLSLRRSDPTRFSVEVGFRNGALIRSDLAGARLLGRLLWGLSYQRHPDTVLVLDPGHLASSPHDGSPSPIVVFGVASRTVLTASAARGLRRPALWRSAPEGTVGWNTASLPGAYAELRARYEARQAGRWVRPIHSPDPPDPVVHDTGNAFAVLAMPEALRDWALIVSDAGDCWYLGEACTEPCYGTIGIDVHAVRHFHRQVSVAARARAEVLAAPDHARDRAELSRAVREHAAVVAARRAGPWDAPS